MAQKADKKRYEASISRLMDIYRGISDSANEVSQWRCPYKNVSDRCTAVFGCRNQLFDQGRENPAQCTGSDELNYRTAWEI